MIFWTNYLKIHQTDFHQIFTKWWIFGRRSLIRLSFPIGQGTLPWQLILGAKSAKSAYSPSLIAQAFRNGLEDHNFDLRKLHGNNFCTLCVNLMAFDPVIAELTRVEILTFGTAGIDQQWS